MNLAPCGLDCDACSLSPEQCDGCHAQSDHLWSPDCAIRVCCISERGLSSCSLCDGFPCAHIEAFDADQWAHHSAAVQRLREMRAARAIIPST
jgi:hypothetical protein